MPTISLEKAMQQLLDEYGSAVRVEVNEVLNDVAKETVAHLRQVSPKRTGRYSRGWRAEKVSETFHNATLTVHNATDWQLTYLLNNGHANRDGGRTAGDHHLDNAEEWANNLLVKKVEEKLKQ